MVSGERLQVHASSVVASVSGTTLDWFDLGPNCAVLKRCCVAGSDGVSSKCEDVTVVDLWMCLELCSVVEC